MNLPYPLLATVIGAIGFATIEIVSRVRGLYTALTSTVWGDALVYVIATVTLAAAFLPVFRRTRGLASFASALGFVIAYLPWAAAIAGVLDLTMRGAWADPVTVQGAFITQPINMMFTFTLELGAVALPLGIVSAFLLRAHARR